jgi:hypothetical protein
MDITQDLTVTQEEQMMHVLSPAYLLPRRGVCSVLHTHSQLGHTDGIAQLCTYVNIFPATALDIRQLLHGHDIACGEVASLDLGVNLDAAVCGDHVVGDGHALVDRDALVDNGVVLHAA